MDKAITIDMFIEAFKEVWEEFLSEEREHISNIYSSNEKWTNFMLCGNDSFLARVTDNLKSIDDLIYWEELYNIDASIVSGLNDNGEDLVGYKSLLYPSKIYALIEHENAGAPEEEVWKLAYRRCPLKVVIFYDFHEDEKRTENQKNWVSTKLNRFIRIIDTINEHCGDEPESEYLFIIGNTSGGIPKWRYVKGKGRSLKLSSPEELL